MAKILGLDIGTSSLGWALVDDQTIIDCGVRIFEMGNKVTQHGEESRREDRTLARSARRRNQRYKLRRSNLLTVLKENGMIPNSSNQGDSLGLYRTRAKALDERISLPALGRLCLYFNKKRGFKSNAVLERALSDDSGAVKQGIAELKVVLETQGHRTVGEYFAHLKEAHHRGERLHERILQRWIGRDQYWEEFNLIWQQQKNHYPSILTDDLLKRVRDRCIFYQRKLKSCKHLVNKCRFESDKRVAPKSHFLYQEFRLLQQLANIRITHGERVDERLNEHERRVLLEVLRTKSTVKITAPNILKKMGLSSRDVQINDVPEVLHGLDSKLKLRKALGSAYWNNLTDSEQERFWHTLYFWDDKKTLLHHAQHKLGLDGEQAEAYVDIRLEPDYGSLSIKAIKKMLPHLKEGMRYDQACAEAGYHHSFEAIKQSKERTLAAHMPEPDQGRVRNPVVLKSLYQIRSLVNELIKVYGKPDMVRIELTRQLKMPRIRRERMRLDNINRERERQGYADFINARAVLNGSIHWKDPLIDKYRLWLELGCAEEDLEDFNGFASRIRPGDMDRYQLWLECNRISPYSGKTISLSRLFSAEIEIEHILPYSKSFDNSFMNKSLCERSENLRKGNRLPAQYMNEVEFKALKRRVKRLPKPKRDRFLMEAIDNEFLHRQLSDTGYIAREAVGLVSRAVRDVQVIPGQATANLRKTWRLNPLLHVEEDATNPFGITKEVSKNRQDHRHHTLDAIVVAYTTRSILQEMARLSQFNELGRLERDMIIDYPIDQFHATIKYMLDRVYVSHENRKRLLSLSINQYRNSKAKNKSIQQGKAPRGSLHEETHYGQIMHPEKEVYVYVSKKFVVGLSNKQVGLIIDPTIRELVKRRLESGVKIDASSPLFIDKQMYGEIRQVPLRHVRVESKKKKMVSLRPSLNPNLFVPTGNNYCIVLYEGLVKGKTKRCYRSIPFLEAIKKAQAKAPLFLQSVSEGDNAFALHTVLKANDFVLMFDQHPDDIEWDNPEWLFDRLYYLIKWSGADGKMTFHKHNIAENDPNTTPKPVVLRQMPNTFSGLKVVVDRLGNIRPIR